MVRSLADRTFQLRLQGADEAVNSELKDAPRIAATLDKQVDSNVQKAEKSFDKKAQALTSGAFAEGEKSMENFTEGEVKEWMGTRLQQRF